MENIELYEGVHYVKPEQEWVDYYQSEWDWDWEWEKECESKCKMECSMEGEGVECTKDFVYEDIPQPHCEIEGEAE